MIDEPEIADLIARLGTALRQRQWRLAVAESCTGGWLSKVCTDQAGSSEWFEAAVVAYTNQVKRSLLNVPAEVLSHHGAVSEATVLAMAQGVLWLLPQADLSVAISGIAGPAGGSAEKPVGTVWCAVCCPSRQWSKAQCMHFSGDREAVRRLSMVYALRLILSLAQNHDRSSQPSPRLS